MTDLSVKLTEQLKIKLLEQLAELEALETGADERVAVVELDQTSIGRLSRMDAMQRQAMNIEAERRREVEKTRILQALKRAESGDLGYCVNCGEAIAIKRLELNPAVPNCIECAS